MRSAVELQGVFVTRNTFRQSYSRVRNITQSVQPPLTRRNYEARAPLSVWHIDGHHKLIRHCFLKYINH